MRATYQEKVHTSLATYRMCRGPTQTSARELKGMRRGRTSRMATLEGLLAAAVVMVRGRGSVGGRRRLGLVQRRIQRAGGQLWLVGMDPRARACVASRAWREGRAESYHSTVNGDAGESRWRASRGSGTVRER